GRGRVAPLAERTDDADAQVSLGARQGGAQLLPRVRVRVRVEGAPRLVADGSGRIGGDGLRQGGNDLSLAAALELAQEDDAGRGRRLRRELRRERQGQRLPLVLRAAPAGLEDELLEGRD